MSMTIKNLLELTARPFRLRVLAGAEELEHIVTWVHMLDHPGIAEFFWGNEMAVTSGYDLQTTKDMRAFIDVLEAHRCAGLVINVGKYVQAVPEEIVRYCAALHFPLLTMPWEMSITEFVRECCSLIDSSDREQEFLAQTVLRVVQNPREAGAVRERLETFFRESDGFVLLAVRMDPGKGWKDVAEHRRALRVHTALRAFRFPYLLIQQENQRFVLLNQRDEQTAAEAAGCIVEAIRQTFGAIPVHVGVSEASADYAGLADCWHGAVAAVRSAELQGEDVVCFRGMGFYRLLYSVPNDDLLRGYYQEVMGPVLSYDAENHGDFAETLFRYVLHDGSLQAVSEQMHTHRNTIYYRMTKIRELLGSGLAGQHERLPFILAYHIGVILRLTPPLEQSM